MGIEGDTPVCGEAESRYCEVLDRIREVVGAKHVITDPTERDFYSHDVWGSGLRPIAVVQPGSQEELCLLLRCIDRTPIAVVPRGGGMSYTAGYLSPTESAVVIDLRRLDRICEVNAEDMYVTVECGATWKSLHDRVTALGRRTPFWGPLSGLRSTVGGALSQGSVFLGSGRYGPSGDSCIGLDVVLADGTLLRLGSHSIAQGRPFYRQHGPDLLGLFLSDAGALGMKTRATLRLVRLEASTEYLSFAFPTSSDLCQGMSAVARLEVASECFAFDRTLQRMLTTSAGLGADLRVLSTIIRGSGVRGFLQGLRTAVAGRRFLRNVDYSLHVCVDGATPAEARWRADRVRQALAGSASSISASIPRIVRSEPFTEVTGMLGPNGERWINVHGIVPFSAAARTLAACDAVVKRHARAIEAHGITTGWLMCGVGVAGILIEPVIFWPDTRHAFHERVLPPEYLSGLESFPENPSGRQAVAGLRKDLAEVLLDAGAINLQIGRFYDYQRGLDPTAGAFLRQIKDLVDPHQRMNPGSLGLNPVAGP